MKDSGKMTSIRIYLDANILYGFFKSLIESWKEKRRHVLPEVIKFFSERNDLYVYTSVLTKCEIFRRLRLDYDISPEDLDRMWNSLEILLKTKMIEWIYLDNQIVEFVKKCKFRSRINNVIHLWLCYKLSLTFVSGDEKICEDGKKVYSGILSYLELRKPIK